MSDREQIIATLKARAYDMRRHSSGADIDQALETFAADVLDGIIKDLELPDAVSAKIEADRVCHQAEKLNLIGQTTWNCFWPRCSDSSRCREYGSCVALAQRAVLRSPQEAEGLRHD